MTLSLKQYVTKAQVEWDGSFSTIWTLGFCYFIEKKS